MYIVVAVFKRLLFSGYCRKIDYSVVEKLIYLSKIDLNANRLDLKGAM